LQKEQTKQEQSAALGQHGGVGPWASGQDVVEVTLNMAVRAVTDGAFVRVHPDAKPIQNLYDDLINSCQETPHATQKLDRSGRCFGRHLAFLGQHRFGASLAYAAHQVGGAVSARRPD
jgi:hypothetical protein